MAIVKKSKSSENNQELTQFVEIIQPTVSPRAKAAVVGVVESFLASLNERNDWATKKTEEAVNVPQLQRLIDPVAGIVIIKTQEEADLAGDLCNDLAAVLEEVTESWDKERGFFHRFHKTLTERTSTHAKVLNRYVALLKDGARRWTVKKNQEIKAQEVKANEIVREADPTAPPVVFEKATVSGLSDRKSWEYNVPDFMALIKAVARGRAPMEWLMIDDRVAKADVRIHHDRAVLDQAGKKFLYEGTVEVYEDISMSRR